MFGIDKMSPAVAAAGLVLLTALAGGPGARAQQEPAPADPHAAHGDHNAEPQPEASDAGHAGHADQAGHTDHADQADPADHADHAPSPEGVPDTPAPAAEVPSPGQPASTLRPDPIDAPAATSVADAQRSADMAAGMAGGHGGHGAHGTGKYRHVDAGRGPDAYQAADEPQDSGAGAHQHDHSSEPAGGEGDGAPARETAASYVCPMHPEVTSETPGTCSKCGMALAPRREE